MIIQILRSNILGNRKIELSLLDILSVDPKQHFNSSSNLSGLEKVEYVSGDYLTWIAENYDRACVQYDFLILFRVLHNMSEFKLKMLSSDEKKKRMPSRYPVFEYLSDYFKTISLLFPEMLDCTKQNEKSKSVYVPQRVFNLSSLVIPDGDSLIAKLCNISKGIIIEDGDLRSESLLKHMSEFNLLHIEVYDLSKILRLSVNHVYWITQLQRESPWPGAKIWPG